MSEQRTGPKVIRILQEFSVPLVAGVVVAILWANIDPHSLHALTETPLPGFGGHLTLHFFTNDILMAFFFGLAAKEITEAFQPGGALNSLRAAMNPAIATIGGVVGPAGCFALWVWWSGDAEIANGWAIPTATDIAVGWLIARLVFGAGHPAIQFLVLLAVLDDGIGLAIIAIFYPDPAHPVDPRMLGLLAAAVAMAWGLRRFGVQNFWVYLAGPGVLAWSGLMLAHLHPALALVPIVPFIPGRGHDSGLYVEEGEVPAHNDPLNKFEHTLKLPVDIGLFAFGLANAGVAFSSVGSATIGVFLGLSIGKTFGVLAFGLLAREIGFPLPRGVDVKCLTVVGMTSGIGLTVSLFMAGAAYTNPEIIGAAKMGALLSVLMAPAALLAGRVLGVRRSAKSAAAKSDEPVEVPA